MGTAVRDLTGQRFGMLTAIRQVERPADAVKTTSAYWECRCDCGKVAVLPRTYLTNSRSAKNCGCIRAARAQAQRREATMQPPRQRKRMNPKLTHNEQVGLKTLEGVTKICPVCKMPFELLSSQWAYKRLRTKGKQPGTTVYYCSWHCLRAVK